MKILFIFSIYIGAITILAIMLKVGFKGILNASLRFMNYVKAHPLFVGFVGFTGEAFSNVGASTMAITVAALLVKKAVGVYSLADLTVFFGAGFFMSAAGWLLKLWYNNNKK